MKPSIGNDNRLAVLRIVGVYILFGTLWIYLSDTILSWIVHDPDFMTRIAIFKGTLFIVLTAILLYSLITRHVQKLKMTEEQFKESEKRYRGILDDMEESYYEVDLEGRFTFFNHSIARTYGYTENELMGASYKMAMDKENIEKVSNAFHQVYVTGETIKGVDWTLRNKNGKMVHVEASVSLRRDSQGILIGFKGITRDITERKKAEEALLESEKRHKSLVEQSPISIQIFDSVGRTIQVNKAFEKLWSVSIEDLKDYNILQDKQLESSGMITYVKKGFSGETTSLPEIEYDARDTLGKGNKSWVKARIYPVKDEQGNVSNVVLLHEDITERKRAEEALEESDTRFRAFMDYSPSLVIIKDQNLRPVYFNRPFGDIFPAKEWLGKTPENTFPPDVAGPMIENDNKALAEGYVQYEEIWKDKTGNEHVFETRKFRIEHADAPPLLGAIINDITDRKRAEESLRQSEATYRFLADKMNDMIWMTNLDFKLTYISPSVKKILGFTPEERTRQTPAEMMTPEALLNAVNILNRELEREHEEGVDPERTVKSEMDFYHKNGSIVPMESVMSAIRAPDGKVIGIHGVSRDITERKQAEKERARIEAQLTQAQKVESIGTLAGGIAHDFNNILSAIIGYTQLAMYDVSEPEKARKELKEVLKASDRAKNLVNQILTFSRKADAKYSPISLNKTVMDSIKMMRSVLPTTIDIRHDIIDNGMIMADPTQIHQVMMNLCTNAAHAMDKNGGVMEVRMRRVDLDEVNQSRLNLPQGTYLWLSVSDTGHGMTPEVMARIFDPYFTTKEVGRGTGLGLSVVHGIVQSHGGTITCTSLPGRGTTFDIYLPEILSEEAVAGHHEERPLPLGTECILFVDDEPVLVKLAENMLSKLGYTVVTRSSSLEALELFQKNPDKYDLVITDMTMPGMTGDRLAQKIIEIRNDIAIILCSGYSDHISEGKAKKIGIREFVMKPLEIKALAKTIREVLDRR